MFTVVIHDNSAFKTDSCVPVKGSTADVLFILPEKLKEYSLIAVFKTAGTIRDIILSPDDNGEYTARIPPALLSLGGYELFCGIYAYKCDETSAIKTEIIPTIWCSLGIIADSADPDEDDENYPTTSLYQQLENKKADKKDLNIHVESSENPHGVTAEQVGAYTKEETLENIQTSGKILTQFMMSHWDNNENPHQVTAEQVGAYTKEETLEKIRNLATEITDEDKQKLSKIEFNNNLMSVGGYLLPDQLIYSNDVALTGTEQVSPVNIGVKGKEFGERVEVNDWWGPSIEFGMELDSGDTIEHDAWYLMVVEMTNEIDNWDVAFGALLKKTIFQWPDGSIPHKVEAKNLPAGKLYFTFPIYTKKEITDREGNLVTTGAFGVYKHKGDFRGSIDNVYLYKCQELETDENFKNYSVRSYISDNLSIIEDTCSTDSELKNPEDPTDNDWANTVWTLGFSTQNPADKKYILYRDVDTNNLLYAPTANIIDTQNVKVYSGSDGCLDKLVNNRIAELSGETEDYVNSKIALLSGETKDYVNNQIANLSSETENYVNNQIVNLPNKELGSVDAFSRQNLLAEDPSKLHCIHFSLGETYHKVPDRQFFGYVYVYRDELNLTVGTTYMMYVKFTVSNLIEDSEAGDISKFPYINDIVKKYVNGTENETWGKRRYVGMTEGVNYAAIPFTVSEENFAYVMGFNAENRQDEFDITINEVRLFEMAKGTEAPSDLKELPLSHGGVKVIDNRDSYNNKLITQYVPDYTLIVNNGYFYAAAYNGTYDKQISVYYSTQELKSQFEAIQGLGAELSEKAPSKHEHDIAASRSSADLTTYLCTGSDWDNIGNGSFYGFVKNDDGSFTITGQDVNDNDIAYESWSVELFKPGDIVSFTISDVDIEGPLSVRYNGQTVEWGPGATNPELPYTVEAELTTAVSIISFQSNYTIKINSLKSGRDGFMSAEDKKLLEDLKQAIISLGGNI